MQIEHRLINRQQSPFIVAELSSNHNQDLNKAHVLIDCAKECGVDAVKFQTYHADSLTVEPKLKNQLLKTYLPWKWHKELFDHCRQVGLIPFSSVFDIESVDYLEDLGCPAYKIASYEIYHQPLLDRVLETGKPMIISTGMASFSYLNHLAIRFPVLNTMILKCVSDYPARPESFNLRTIPDMIRNFGMEVGLSDHTNGIGVSLASIALGATMIERHFTVEKSGLPDDPFSLNYREMKVFVKSCHDAWKALGSVDYGINGDRQHLRSLWCIKDMKKGDRFSGKNIEILRPNDGDSPTQYKNYIDKKSSCDIKRGTPLHRRYIG